MRSFTSPAPPPANGCSPVAGNIYENIAGMSPLGVEGAWAAARADPVAGLPPLTGLGLHRRRQRVRDRLTSKSLERSTAALEVSAFAFRFTDASIDEWFLWRMAVPRSPRR